MSKRPYMPFYIDDYLSATIELSTFEHGCYMLLLIHLWRAGGELPNDPAKLARICRCSQSHFKKAWSSISPFFEIRGTKVTQHRVSHELRLLESRAEQKRKAASARWHDKPLKNNNPSDAGASEPHMRAASGSDATPDSIPQTPEEELEPTIRGEAQCAKPEDLDKLEATLRAAAGQALRAAAPQLFVMAAPQRWLSNGADLNRDVLPAVRSVAASAQPNSVASWEYFDRAVTQATTDRMNGRSRGDVDEFKSQAPLDPEQLTAEQWRTSVKLYREWLAKDRSPDWKRWNDGLGPRPDELGCKAPYEILAEFDFARKRDDA